MGTKTAELTYETGSAVTGMDAIVQREYGSLEEGRARGESVVIVRETWEANVR